MTTNPLTGIQHYSDANAADDDLRRLEEAGFHPTLRASDPGSDRLDEPTGAAGEVVVLCVPGNEADEAFVLLQRAMEAQGDPREEGIE